MNYQLDFGSTNSLQLRSWLCSWMQFESNNLFFWTFVNERHKSPTLQCYQIPLDTSCHLSPLGKHERSIGNSYFQNFQVEFTANWLGNQCDLSCLKLVAVEKHLFYNTCSVLHLFHMAKRPFIKTETKSHSVVVKVLFFWHLYQKTCQCMYYKKYCS